MRVIVFLLLFTSGLGFSAETNFVGTFAGKWRQHSFQEPDKEMDSGDITLTIERQNDRVMEGKMTLTNTPQCKGEIPLRGIVGEKEVVLESNTNPVCGASGKLVIKIIKSHPPYTGQYVYKYGGLTLIQGTFVVSPKQNSQNSKP